MTKLPRSGREDPWHCLLYLRVLSCGLQETGRENFWKFSRRNESDDVAASVHSYTRTGPRSWCQCVGSRSPDEVTAGSSGEGRPHEHLKLLSLQCRFYQTGRNLSVYRGVKVCAHQHTKILCYIFGNVCSDMEIGSRLFINVRACNASLCVQCEINYVKCLKEKISSKCIKY